MRGAPDIDDRVALSLDYTQIGMLLGCIGIVQLKLNGKTAELAQRQLEALRGEMLEQIQEQLPDFPVQPKSILPFDDDL